MAFYSQTMLQIALELALHDPVRQATNSRWSARPAPASA
jgi:hypothetical protein